MKSVVFLVKLFDFLLKGVFWWFAWSCVSLVTQVLKSRWDTCVAISAVFPVFCLRTFSSSCSDCLHFLLGFLLIVVPLLFCLCPAIVLPSVLNPRAAPRCGQITESIRFSGSSSCRKQLSSKYPPTSTAFFYHQRGCEQKEAARC